MMHSLTAVLLPCIVSGYALASSYALQLHLYDKPGANYYFRILLTGFLWFGFCIAAVFLLTEDGYSWERFMSFFEDSLTGSKAYLFGYGATLVAVLVRRLVLDTTYSILGWSQEMYLETFLLPFLRGRGKNMELFLIEAISKSHLVVFVMKNDRVYVAWIRFVGTLKDSPEWLNLYLVTGGCVDKESRVVKIAKSRLSEAEIRDERSHMEISVAVREIVAMKLLEPRMLQSDDKGAGEVQLSPEMRKNREWSAP